MRFSQVTQYIPELLQGLWVSIWVSMLSFLIGGILGVILAYAKGSENKWANWPARIYIETFRNTPLLVQLYLVYFGLGQVGWNFNAVESTLIALSLNTAAYVAEIVRGGFEAVPTGQWEAGFGLGLGRSYIFRRIIFIPGLRNIFPALINQLIIAFLFSSIAAIISLHELTDVMQLLVTRTGLALEIFLIGGLMYYVVSLLLGSAARYGERWLFRW